MTRPPPKPRGSGCWLIGCTATIIAAALVALGLILPPIDLPDRLEARAYTALNAGSPLLIFDSDLRLRFPDDSAASDFALKISRLSQAEFLADSPDHPQWLPAARGALPAKHRLLSKLYILEARGAAPASLLIELSHAAESKRLALRGWDGGSWRFIPSARAGDVSTGTADYAPLALALFERLPAAPIVQVSQEIQHDLKDEVIDLTTILSPAGLRPSEQGALVGSLAPGGDSDSAYQYMPLLRNFIDPQALDVATVEAILGNAALRERHIEQIGRLVSVNQFDGVFIDYRGFSAAHSEHFAQFVTDLGKRLSQQGSRLGIVVAAERNSAKEWHGGGYDWRRLGAAADYFLLRATLHPQDFTPGAAGNLERLLQAAASAVEGHKILLGLSASPQRQINGMLKTTGWRAAFAPAGDVILQADDISETGSIEPGTVVRASLSGYGLRLGFNQDAQTAYLDYINQADAPVARTWLTDAAALRHRLDQTLPFAIAGVAFADLLAVDHSAPLIDAITSFMSSQPSQPDPSRFAARWSIDAADGPLDQIDTELDEDLILTLEAPDGNYAVNWSVISGNGAVSGRQGAVLPLFKPTLTPTPTPTPVPRRVAAAPGNTTDSAFNNAPPAAGSIRIEIGGHVTDTGSARAVDAMRAAGMTWMKKQERFYWQGPADIGSVITTAHNNGFKILIGAVGDPGELARGGQPYIESFTDWLQRIAGQGADAIEVWNEPNLDREWPRGQISGLAYAEMLALAYRKIKQVNPATMVISAAPAPTGVSDRPDRVMPDNRWLRQMVEGGGLNHLDCVGVHYNEGIVPPAQTSGDPRLDNYYTRYFYGMLHGYISITRRPICFTELGYLTSDGLPNLPEYFSWAKDVTLQQQANWLAQAAALASQSGQVRLLIVWNIDFTAYGADPQAGYAILRRDGSCPACAALAAAR